MRRILISAILAASFVIALSSSAQAASCNGAYGCVAFPGSGCVVLSTEPFFDGPSSLSEDGGIECSTAHTFSLKVCTQVHNSNGQWYTVAGSCGNSSARTTYWDQRYDVSGVVQGHTYRGLSQGCLGSGNCLVETAYSGAIS